MTHDYDESEIRWAKNLRRRQNSGGYVTPADQRKASRILEAISNKANVIR